MRCDQSAGRKFFFLDSQNIHEPHVCVFGFGLVHNETHQRPASLSTVTTLLLVATNFGLTQVRHVQEESWKKLFFVNSFVTSVTALSVTSRVSFLGSGITLFFVLRCMSVRDSASAVSANVIYCL